MASAASATELRALWNAFLRAEALALPRVHRALHAEHGLTLSEFSVLRGVACAEPATMTDLQDRAVMSAAGITRVVSSLEAAGLVRRSRRADDRRLIFAQLTAKGRVALDAAQRTVDAEVLTLLDGRSAKDDLAAATRVLMILGSSATLDR